MGHLFSAPISSMVVHYLGSLQENGEDTIYIIEEYQTEFPLNKFPGSDDSPVCWMSIKDSSIQISQDLRIDSQPLRAKSSKITLDIGEVIVGSSDLRYVIRVTGKITFYDVLVKVTFTPKFENGIRISDIGSENTVNKIKSQILLNVNGTDHSRLANVLLNIDNPNVAGNVMNAVFMLMKEVILEWLNKNLREIARRCGFH